MTYYEAFKQDWVSIYANQYKKATHEGRIAIKSNLYKNIQFTDKQKDKIWDLIIKKSGYLK